MRNTTLAFLIALIIGAVTYNSVNLLCALFVSPLFGLRCVSVSFFGLTMTRTDNGWQTARGRFSPGIQTLTVIDIRRNTAPDSNKATLKFSIVRIFIKAVLALAVTLLTGQAWEAFITGRSTFGYNIAILYCAFLWITVLTDIGTTVFVHGFVMRGLGGYVQQLADYLRAGGTFDRMQLRPLEELPYPNATNTEKIMYLMFYCEYLLDADRTEELRYQVYTLCNMLSGEPFSLQFVLAYMMLIFYYSRYEINPEIASLFYDKASAAMATDNDANTKRVLAYYAYGIQHDPQKARFFIGKALEVIDKFSPTAPAENRLERRLINELDETLKKQGF